MENSIYTLQADSLAKRFKKNTLFKNISFFLKTGDSLCITGHNGSGKSTLLKILAGLQKQTAGIINTSRNDIVMSYEENVYNLGFISPFLNPYGDLSGYENIKFALKHGSSLELADDLLTRFNLIQHRNKKTKYYSSGMVQRLKCIIALINNPPMLFMDEPSTNMDLQGKEILYSYIEAIRENTIIVLATNESNERTLCTKGIDLG